MKNIFLRMKEKLTDSMHGEEEQEEKPAEEYVELGPETKEEGKAKIIVRPFVVEEFDDIKPILDDLREGYTIALVNIKPLKDKDLIELKRAVNKLKKTTDAIDGDIAGFGEDYIVVTPSFASVHRSKQTADISEGDSGEEKAPAGMQTY